MKRFTFFLAAVLIVSGGVSLSYDSQGEKATIQKTEVKPCLIKIASDFEVSEIIRAASPSETPKRLTATNLIEGSEKDVVAQIRGPTGGLPKVKTTQFS